MFITLTPVHIDNFYTCVNCNGHNAAFRNLQVAFDVSIYLKNTQKLPAPSNYLFRLFRLKKCTSRKYKIMIMSWTCYVNNWLHAWVKCNEQMFRVGKCCFLKCR